MANAAAVDAKEPDAGGLHLGKRTRRARRQIAPSLFDKCEMVPVLSFEVGCARCGLRASYEIRPAEIGAGRELVRGKVLNERASGAMAEECETHPDQCAASAYSGLDFRAIATLAGQTYLVVGKSRAVAADGTGVQSGELFPDRNGAA